MRPFKMNSHLLYGTLPVDSYSSSIERFLGPRNNSDHKARDILNWQVRLYFRDAASNTFLRRFLPFARVHRVLICVKIWLIYPPRFVPFTPADDGDSNNFRILPQARQRRDGNPLTCKTVLPLGLPRRLLLHEQSVFFPVAHHPPTTTAVSVPIPPSPQAPWTTNVHWRRDEIDRATNIVTLSGEKVAWEFNRFVLVWKRRRSIGIDGTISTRLFYVRLINIEHDYLIKRTSQMTNTRPINKIDIILFDEIFLLCYWFKRSFICANRTYSNK